MQLEKIQNSSPKIPELVMQSLINAIESGQIRVGEDLPSERDLAEKLGVGRGSLRECLAILEFLGAIESRGNRKALARDADYIRKAISFIRISNQPDTQKDFTEFRSVNEVAIVGFACERATEEDLKAIEATLVRMATEPGDYMADVEFHDALAVASHNTMLAGTIHLVNSMIADIRISLFGLPNYAQRALESHQAIYNAIKARNVQVAEYEMKRHLDIAAEYLKQIR